MFQRIFSRFNPLYKRYPTSFSSQSRKFHWNGYQLPRKSIMAPLLAAGYALYMPVTMNLQEKNQVNAEDKQQSHEEAVKIQSKTLWEKIMNAFIHSVRFFQLLIIFMPTILLSPLLLFKSTKQFWMGCFVKAIERAGVVWIKAFQYLSHRRDMIGPELAEKVEYLRENAPTHSLETTRQNFRQAYGKNVEQIFEDFDPIPVASGSVSQVYRAKYKGKKVAIKVRHPNVDKYIERDVNLMFFMSYLASFISPAMQLPVSQSSLKRTLTEQIDFTFQMRNLNKFNEMFKESKEVHFPFPFEETTVDSVLVQTFIKGVPVTYYEKKPHAMNKVIARLGSTTFFEMLMKNNFIHADCHGGNIFIEMKEQSYCMLSQITSYLKQVIFTLQTKIKSMMNFDTLRLKKLYIQSRQEELDIMKMIRKYRQKITVNLIDVGMVIQLNETDKKNFVSFIKSIIEGRGEICAQMIFKLSNFEGKKIMEGKFQDYYNQLLKCFSILSQETLEDLQGIDIFIDMLSIIRENRMKLDGQFATLLTNMIVLESIAKSIDPEIKILKCAFPYFKYVDDVSLYSK